MRRRALLRAGVVLPIAALAGCTGSPDDSPSPTAGADAGGDGGTDAPTATPAPTDAGGGGGSPTPADGSPGTPTGTPALDLREANVTDVAVSGSGGQVEFDVTLYHDDDGEDGYANWWQVERLDGTRLGRRDLLHAHGTREFTRSATVEVPAEVSCVVVRGHDQTHEYGGRTALVNLDSGAARFVEQGSDPRTFSAADCP
ncbi:hypothetical protein BRC93_15330 [Halobacteriales archaeon QS_5_70_15]|jgi:hypothetical protein|nr:MAG: hypothetical protein BRC93_15330 [Halobacteriales archaeon QS_5_70_15]